MPRYTHTTKDAALAALETNKEIDAVKIRRNFASLSNTYRLAPILLFCIIGIIFTLFSFGIISLSAAFISLNVLSTTLLSLLFITRYKTKKNIALIALFTTLTLVSSFLLYFFYSAAFLNTVLISAGFPLYGTLSILGALALFTIAYTYFSLPKKLQGKLLKPYILIIALAVGAIIFVALFFTKNQIFTYMAGMVGTVGLAAIAVFGVAAIACLLVGIQIVGKALFWKYKSTLLFKNEEGKVVELNYSYGLENSKRGNIGQVKKGSIKRIDGKKLSIPISVAVKIFDKGEATLAIREQQDWKKGDWNIFKNKRLQKNGPLFKQKANNAVEASKIIYGDSNLSFFSRATSNRRLLISPWLKDDLRGFRNSSKRPPFEERLTCVSHLINQLIRLHKGGRIHGDLKLENVMRNSQSGGQYFLTDFDDTTEPGEAHENAGFTEQYLDPERFKVAIEKR